MLGISSKERFSKILGTYLGISIGDALGMPVETWSSSKINKEFGLINEYKSPKNHKWYDGFMPGVTTDDTQLTVALAESLIANNDVNMDDIAMRFVESFKHRNVGWGGSTQDAAMRLALKTHTWLNSGEPSKPGRGGGNGVAMKIAPLAMMAYLNLTYYWELQVENKYIAHATQIAKMTHDTMLGISSAWVQFAAVLYCLECPLHLEDEEDIKKFGDEFTGIILNTCLDAEKAYKSVIPMPEEEDRLSKKLWVLRDMHRSGSITRNALLKTFKGGKCYVPSSLPLTYGIFVMNPTSIDTLYKTASAGGDTDTNASMVGALLGALNGNAIFPGHLRDGLLNADKIANLADRFYHTFSHQK